MDGFTHMNPEGRPRMVDVTHKPPTARRAVARGSVKMRPETLEAIREGQIAKGDVLAVAQVAGVMGAKQTGAWIPMCHPLPISGCDLRFRLNAVLSQVEIEATVSVNGPTGVEMEALTAVSAAALTIYDMAKALDKAMTIGPCYLVAKEGGKSGPYHQFRAQVETLHAEGRLQARLELPRGAQIQLVPSGEEPLVDRPAIRLTLEDLQALAPGVCLEAGEVRLEVRFAREHGWLVEVDDPGVLQPGDWIIQAS